MSNNALERNSTYTKSMFVKDATFEYYEDDLSDTVIVDGLTLSLVSGRVRKNLYTTKPVLTKEMHDEIKTLKQNTMAYVRLDVKVGKKRKSTWTRFTIKP
jgi:ethanolamine ammonia-lyase small subunit